MIIYERFYRKINHKIKILGNNINAYLLKTYILNSRKT